MSALSPSPDSLNDTIRFPALLGPLALVLIKCGLAAKATRGSKPTKNSANSRARLYFTRRMVKLLCKIQDKHCLKAYTLRVLPTTPAFLSAGSSSFLYSSDDEEAFLAHRGNVRQPLPRRETARLHS